MMKRGALAMFDALGFRTIWRDKALAEKVLPRLDHLQKKANEVALEVVADLGPTLQKLHGVTPVAKVSALSDTIVIGVTLEDAKGATEEIAAAISSAEREKPSETTEGGSSSTPAPETDALPEPEEPSAATPTKVLDGLAVLIAAWLTADTIEEALREEPRFAYRGCIGVGDFAMEGRFVVGSAVQSVADAMNEAAGAFVWLLPTASAAVNAATRARVAQPTTGLLWEAPIPFKGHEMKVQFVTPFMSADGDEERRKIYRALLGTFDSKGERSDRLDVAAKRDATRRVFWSVVKAMAASEARQKRIAAARPPDAPPKTAE